MWVSLKSPISDYCIFLLSRPDPVKQWKMVVLDCIHSSCERELAAPSGKWYHVMKESAEGTSESIWLLCVFMGHLCDLGKPVILSEPHLQNGDENTSLWGVLGGPVRANACQIPSIPSTIEKSSQDPVTNLSQSTSFQMMPLE